jgi:hypothetical protein
MFKKFNETTLHMLAFELLEERRFKFGEAIVRQHKRSTLNHPHQMFNKRQTNAILVSVMEERKKIDGVVKDLATSTFALMLKFIARQANQMLQHKGCDFSSHAKTDVSNHPEIEAHLRMEHVVSKRVKRWYSKEEDDSDRGVFIIEVGRCTVVNT